MPYVQGLSIACSTPEAIKWDKDFEGAHEISGRAMRNVHLAGNEFTFDKHRQHQPQLSGAATPSAVAEARNGSCENGAAVAATLLENGSIEKGRILPQTAPLPAVQPQQPGACLRLDIPKGVAQAAKANGIHVAAS